jgi:broad specificity phosphatase PhoE
VTADDTAPATTPSYPGAEEPPPRHRTRGVQPIHETGRHEIFVIRHGATEWSRNGRHTGRTDLPLLPDGEAEAASTGRLLHGREFALVLVSPLSRARRTCELAGYGDQAELCPDLLEWDYGDYEGITTAVIRETVPGWTVWDSPVPQGERIEQVADRADRVITRARAADGDVALFGHGHILRVIAARWCELDAAEGKRFPLETASLCILGWEHEYPTLRVWNQR